MWWRALAALVVALPLAAAGQSDTTVLRIPLENGRVELRDVLEAVFDAAGLDPGERIESVDATIDVGSTVGRMRLYLFERILPGAVESEVTEEALIITIDREAIRRRSEELVDSVTGAARDAVLPPPDPRRFGLTVVTPQDARAPLDRLPAGTTRAVVLVHGLDDPGFMWDDLAPRLLAEGHVVVRFEYRNDQPIADSADDLAHRLAELASRGVKRIDIVAHSMGGLVARDALTRRVYYDGDGRGDDRLPRVDRLIMLGTPNHGAPVARLRGLTEVREVVVRWARGERGLLDAMADGAGEAGRDLLPDSDYLRRLNRRPLPRHTRLTIVAGRLAPFSREEAEQALEGWPRPEGASDAAADRLAQWVGSVVNGLGDGVVSLESARLEGVDDFQVVEAGHLGMILDYGRGDDAPAIPIVLDRLAGDLTP